MTNEQKAAYVMSQSVCALADIEGMKAENMIRESLGHSMAYDEKSFAEVPAAYGLGSNTILELFHED